MKLVLVFAALLLCGGCADPPHAEIPKSAKTWAEAMGMTEAEYRHAYRLDTDCSATFTDAATETALYPGYFYSREGVCREEDAWDHLRATTNPEQFAGAKFVQMGTPLDQWIKVEGNTIIPLVPRVRPVPAPTAGGR